MADSKKYNGSTWRHSLRKLGTDTDTFTTLPTNIITDGTNASIGLVGNMSQTGTPTPDSPIMPQGTGERTAQLIPYPFYSSDGEYAGVQFTTDNGRVIANGTLTSGLLYYLWRPAKFPAGTYTMSVKGKHSGATIYFRDTTHNVSVVPIYSTQEGDRSVTFTVTEEISAMVYINTSYGTLDFDCTIMLNTGEEALPFEPTNGYKIPILSANTTTPVYLGEVQTTRKIRKYECTGDESWSVTSVQGKTRAVANFTTSIGIVPLSKVVSTHYIGVEGGAAYPDINTITVNNNGTMIIGISSEYTDANAFKAYLTQQYAAGTPVTVWYVLANPTTGIVNEPLMKIGDYADTVSMEQAGVQIPTNRGNTVIDVETTLKPSEVSLTYTGWHDAEVKEWDGSEWQ